MTTLYIAGPMTGYRQFNFPAFHEAAIAVRAMGFEVISPAEMDEESDVAEKAMCSVSGDLVAAGITETWGDLLARDVKIVSDEVDGICLLPGWEDSRGARLEAFVGILCDKNFYMYRHGAVFEITAAEVLREVYDATV